jgi:glucose 1-dehydrogenase
MRVVITGAASGIGRATAEILSGATNNDLSNRLLLVDRDADRLAETAEALGSNAHAFVADLSDPNCGERIAKAALDNLGGIDGVASNAGIILSGPLTTLDIDGYDKIFAINTRANWLLAKAVYPHLKESRGAFVATASISAHQPTPGLGAYSASKAALLMLVRQLAIEWGPDGIRVNSVSPGPTLTPMTAQGYSDPERLAQREASIPLRKLGSAEDIANAIVFLLSPQAGHISGIDILVDGALNNNLMNATGTGTGQGTKK